MGKILFLCFLPGTYPDPVPDPAYALSIIVKSINKVLVKHYVTNYEIVNIKITIGRYCIVVSERKDFGYILVLCLGIFSHLLFLPFDKFASYLRCSNTTNDREDSVVEICESFA